MSRRRKYKKIVVPLESELSGEWQQFFQFTHPHYHIDSIVRWIDSKSPTLFGAFSGDHKLIVRQARQLGLEHPRQLTQAMADLELWQHRFVIQHMMFMVKFPASECRVIKLHARAFQKNIWWWQR